MAATIIFDVDSPDAPLSCYSMLDRVPVSKFSFDISKWSLLTGKMWTCGYKKWALVLHYRVVSELRQDMQGKTIGASKLWS